MNRSALVCLLLASTTFAEPPATTLPAGHPPAEPRIADRQPQSPNQPNRNEPPDRSNRSDQPKPIPSSQPLSEKTSVTDHALRLRDTTLTYRATAGLLPHLNDDGKPTANFFYVAYTKTPVDLARPVTFVFNGGPGAAAVWLHLGTAGPKVISFSPVRPTTAPTTTATSAPMANGKWEMGNPVNPPPSPGRLIDNPSTWLLSTDLVFIDPIGTGYSRMAEGEKSRDVYSTQGDISSVAEFVRLYLTRNNRWSSPKFLAGESYGTTRAAALSDHLADRHGIAVNGIVLISTVLDFATLSPADGNDLPYALYLPSYTASAHFHRKLPADLQSQPLDKLLPEVERFATTDYIAALYQGVTLPDDRRRALADRLARYTGLTADYVLKNDLRISPWRFEKMLLNDRRQIAGRFDARVTAFDQDPASDSPGLDPSLTYYFPLYSTTVNDYLRRALGFETDAAYEILSGRVHPWNFGEKNGYLNVATRLRDAMIANPHLKVLVASGYTDLATPYLATTYTLNRLALAPELRQRITETHYPAGHMMYHREPSREQLNNDVNAFISANR